MEVEINEEDNEGRKRKRTSQLLIFEWTKFESPNRKTPFFLPRYGLSKGKPLVLPVLGERLIQYMQKLIYIYIYT